MSALTEQVPLFHPHVPPTPERARIAPAPPPGLIFVGCALSGMTPWYREQVNRLKQGADRADQKWPRPPTAGLNIWTFAPTKRLEIDPGPATPITATFMLADRDGGVGLPRVLMHHDTRFLWRGVAFLHVPARVAAQTMSANAVAADRLSAAVPIAVTIRAFAFRVMFVPPDVAPPGFFNLHISRAFRPDTA